MKYSYFRQVLSNYTVIFIVVQWLFLLVIVGFYRSEIHHQQQQTLELSKFFNRHSDWAKSSIQNHTGLAFEQAYERIEAWDYRIEYLDISLEVQELTKCFIEEMKGNTGEGKYCNKGLNINEVLDSYCSELLTLLDEYAYFVDTSDIWAWKERYAPYISFSDSSVLQSAYQNFENKELELNLLKKIENDIRIIENALIHTLTWKITGLCGFPTYQAHISSQEQLWKGDTLHAKFFVTEKAFKLFRIVLENDTINIRTDGMKSFEVIPNANEFYEYQLSGQILQTDGWGKTTSYPFVHDYEVVPKCN